MTSIEPVTGLDPAHRDLFAGWAATFESAARAEFGDDHDAWGEEELRALERSSTRTRVCAAATIGTRVVGGAVVLVPTRDNLDTATVVVAVAPDARRRGTGTALLAWAEATAARLGRSVLHSETAWRAGPDPYAGWATARGYTPALEVLRSDLALDPLAASLASGRLSGVAAHGDPYVLESCVDGIPESWVEDRALLSRRMSTDAPGGDLLLEEEEWDAERVRAEVATAAEMGRRTVETVARHVPSGRLVGVTHVQVVPHRPELAYQHDTLVLREHRGHRLGLRLKAANARAPGRRCPPRTIRTWNALDNAPMLAVNRALGYRPSGHEREWQKGLPDRGGAVHGTG